MAVKIREDLVIGNKEIILMAGPCAVESQEQIIKCAECVKKAGAKVLRGGAFKARTSPDSFQGLGYQGLVFLKEAADLTGLAVVTEALDTRHVETVAQFCDIIQIGSRNMYNYPLLKEIAMTGKPVLLKRGLSATVEEWMSSAEYLVTGGNKDIIFCERGIRTFSTYTRNTLDLSVVPVIKHNYSFPVIVDPSHGTGHRWMVNPLSLAAVAVGCDGLLIEVHPDPDKALSDGYQSLSLTDFSKLIADVKKVATAVGREL